MELKDQDLLQKLSKDDSRAFALLFKRYYKDLVLYAGSYIRDMAASEDVVQTIFLKLWADRKEAEKIDSLKAYLLKAVQNSCLSHLRHEQTRNKYSQLKALSIEAISHETEEYLLYSELSARLQQALSHLSPLQRQCFEMNRINGIKQATIAETLNVSLRTVELKIAESLKILKTHLKEYFLLILLFLLP